MVIISIRMGYCVISILYVESKYCVFIFCSLVISLRAFLLLFGSLFEDNKS